MKITGQSNISDCSSHLTEITKNVRQTSALIAAISTVTTPKLL